MVMRILMWTMGLTVGAAIAACAPPEAPKTAQRENTPVGNGNRWAPELPGPAVGTEAPDIIGEDLDGVAFKLSDYRGQVVMLDFWGNW
jgi:hypothetical protein